MSIFRCMRWSTVWLLALAAGAGASDPAWDAMLANVETIESEKEAATAHETYLADSVTEIRNADGKLDRRVESTRRVTRQGTEPSKVDYLMMKVNGKELSEKDRNAKGPKFSANMEGQSPFAPGEIAKYEFEPSGTSLCAGYPVWVVSFHPKKPAKDLASGQAFIHRENSNLIRLEFTTSVLPGSVQSMKAVLNFSPQAGYWLPADLTIDLHIKVSFIFTLAEKQVNVKERYYDYQAPPSPQAFPTATPEK